MKLIFILFYVSIIVEALLYVAIPLWKWRKILSVAAMLISTFAAGALFMWQPGFVPALVAVASLYRAVNTLRIVKGRMHDMYLYNATRRTAAVLAASQVLLLGIWWLWHQFPADHRDVWFIGSVLQAVAAALLLFSTIRSLRKTHPLATDKHYSDSDLPSITIAIPARNETEDLQHCLESIIANDYPKFEVIVLDDCSQNKRTPEIIRSFAHDGVRFIPGEEPKDTWLPKNQAYDRLAQEASGEFILFCGVDIRFNSDTIRKLVQSMLAKDKLMASILPLRVNGAIADRALIQAMRYWWELAPPRRFFNRPPVLSSSWIIQRHALQKIGGFAAVSRSIVPEAFFARELIKTDAYTFVRSDESMGVQSVKAAQDQRDTAIRTRYPQLHRKPEQVWFVTIAESFWLLMPFIVAIGGFWLEVSWFTQLLSGFAAALLAITYSLIAVATRVNKPAFAVWAFPLAVVIDLFLLQRSMWLYEFNEVLWKGRNVCIPVMHTYAHLPKLPVEPQETTNTHA